MGCANSRYVFNLLLYTVLKELIRFWDSILYIVED